MSERGGRSFSDISLLLEASMGDAQPGSERDTLARYKQVYAQITAENLRLQNLRDMLKEMARLGETETESYRKCQDDAKKCVAEIDKLDSEARNISSKKLQPLVKRLREKAFEEERRAGQIAMENYRREAIAHQEQVVQEWQAKRNQALANRAKNQKSQDLCSLENQIGELRKQIRQIEDDLSQLKWCWFGEKRTYKNKLKAEQALLQNQLLELYKKRRLLESSK